MISVHTSPLAAPGSLEVGGMNTYVRELSRELSRRGIWVDVFTRWQAETEPPVVEFDERCRVANLRVGPPQTLAKDEVFRTLPEFANAIDEFRRRERLEYDVVHSHYWLSGWIGRQLAEQWRVPHIIMFHTVAAAKLGAWPEDEESSYRWPTELGILKSADAIVVASPHEKALIDHMCDNSNDRIVTIPCGVNLGLFRPLDKATAKSALGLSGKKVVLFVGRLVPLKGVDILVEATARLPVTLNSQVVVVGGQGEGDRELRRLRWLAEELGLNGRVRFDRAVDHRLLVVYYSAADVCVIPSHYESFGLVAAEALACGTPVIASKVGGLPTIIQDGFNGLLVPWRCPQAFADKIAEVLTNEHLGSQLRRHARQSVLHLSWGNTADQVVTLYQSVLSGRARTRECRELAGDDVPGGGELSQV